MSYQRGFLNSRITLWNPTRQQSEYGAGYIKYTPMVKVWANVTFVKGQRAMRNGEIDVYQFAMVRLDCHPLLNRRTRIEYDGRYWIVDSFNRDLEKNECQFTIFEIDDIEKIDGDTPVEPTDPETPVEPTDPETPVEPTDPETPVEPTGPETPVEPTDPETPVEPTDPETPVEPTDPETPVEPTYPEVNQSL